jgi:predicted anti-sigma-YlaC factor YlaD
MSSDLSESKDCCHFKELIQKRLDGEITPVENETLNLHLADCDGCRDELVSYSVVRDLLNETIDNPVEVPEGFFESLAEQLEEKEQVRGFARIFSLPIFTTFRNVSLAAASFVLVAILGLSVVQGITGQSDQASKTQPAMANSQALIQTNRGDTIIIPGDAGDSAQYAAALDDLEKAYEEASGLEDNSQADGYITTSWNGERSETPIH